MKKFATLAAALAAATLSAQALAAPSNPYIINGITTGSNVDASGTVNLSFTPEDNPFSGVWYFVDNGDGTVNFNGNMYFGDYETYTTVSVPFFGSMDGTVSVEGAEHTIGTNVSPGEPLGSWDPATLTFTFDVPSGGPNSSAGSNYTETGSSCEGSGSVLGNTVCGTQGNTTPEWEGISVELVFSSDLSSFTGTVVATEQSGSGLTENVTTLFYEVSGTEVPLPAAAWLFGTGLIGLAGVARRRQRKTAA